MANNIIIKDGLQANNTLRTVDIGGGIQVPVHANFDSTGAEIFIATANNQTTEISILTSLQNSAANTSTVNIAQDSSILYLGNTAVTPLRSTITASASGNNNVVAAVSSKKIRVLSYTLIGSGAVNPKFQSNNVTDLTGLLYIAATGGGHIAPFNPTGHFDTAVGEPLTINLSGATAVGGYLTYITV